MLMRGIDYFKVDQMLCVYGICGRLVIVQIVCACFNYNGIVQALIF